ncbi:MAG: hypothetical protein IBX47_13265 [Desulfuromonadales bacterium]|nr:hypothetical protein [Desulfuromonadales bacterium]
MKTYVRHTGHVPCPECQEPLPRLLFNRSDGGECPHCNTRILVSVFPALFADPKQERVTENNRQDEDQAGCYFHPHKVAALSCAGCGLFLCLLCETEIGGRHICPRCLENEIKEQSQTKLVTHRVLYEQMAFALAFYPLIFPFVTLFTAPAALFVAVRYWKAPRSLVSTSRWRTIVAIIGSILQILGWLAIFSGALS